MPYPKVFLSVKNRSAPCVVRNAQEESALDRSEWTPVPSPNPPGNSMYPKLMYNVNLPWTIVFDRQHEDRLGSDWRQSPVVLPNDPPVTLIPEGVSLPKQGDIGAFRVTISGYGKSNAWIATKDDYADWLTFTPTDPQNADGTVNFNCGSNLAPGSYPRTAHIYVNGQTFTIDQDG